MESKWILKVWVMRRIYNIRSVLLGALYAVALVSIIGILSSGMVFADEEEDLAEMQRKLNAEVLDKPFSVEDAAKIDAYIKDALKKDLKPEAKPPTVWRTGYTCGDLLRHHYNYRHYRNCLYYHRYNGYYWR